MTQSALRQTYLDQRSKGLLPSTPPERDLLAGLTQDPVCTMRFVLPKTAQWLVTEHTPEADDQEPFFFGFCFRRYAGGTIIESLDYFSLRNLENEHRVLQIVDRGSERLKTIGFNQFVRMDLSFKPSTISQIAKGNFRL